MLLLRYFDLILYKTFADLRSEAAKTYIGFLWWVLDPIISMIIFYVVFGLLMKRGTEDFVPFLLVGLTAWRWFHSSINNGGNSILISKGLIRQVFIPKAIFPLVVILTDFFKFSFVLGILLVFLWIYGFDITITYLAFPLVIIVQLILIAGITIFLAAITPFFPDSRLLVNHVLQLLFYVSGIFFSDSIVPEQYRVYFYLNPMATIIKAYRDTLMYNQWPDWDSLGIIAFLSVFMLLTAYQFLAYNEHQYPKLNN